MRRTSKRTSRRLRPNERMFVDEISPLDYEPTGFPKGSVRRLALIDTEAPRAPEGSRLFEEHRTTSLRGPTGRALKKPRVIVTPGATPNTIAFVDFYAHGDQAYINYMTTRSDFRGKKIAKTLIDAFMDRAEKSGIRHVNFGKVLAAPVWKLYETYRALYEGGASKISVSAKHYF